MKLQAKIERDLKTEPMSCQDIDWAMTVANFDEIDRLERLASNTQSIDDKHGYSIQNGVAVIKVRGLLVPHTNHDYTDWGVTGYNVITDYLGKANEDSGVNSILLDINSGGGYIRCIDEVLEAILQSKKVVHTHASGDMYSCAYWIGSTAQYVTAEKHSGIGSIGVRNQHYEYSKRLEQDGVTISEFVSGKWKNAFSELQKLKPFAKERLQQSVDETAQVFFEHVAEYRGIDSSLIKSWEADTFNANEALEKDLIDEIVDSLPIPKEQADKNSFFSANHNSQQETKPINPKEKTMDELEMANAKINELQGQVADKDRALTQANADKSEAEAKLVTAESKLSALKESTRKSAIDDLTVLTGKEYSAEEVKTMTAMDDSAFAMLKEVAMYSKPKLPSGLEQDKLTGGRNGSNAETSDLDKKFESWANNSAK